MEAKNLKKFLEEALKNAKGIICWDTSMHLDLICEELCKKTGEDNFTFQGRSIYYKDKRIASIATCLEGKNCVSIYAYKILIKN